MGEWGSASCSFLFPPSVEFNFEFSVLVPSVKFNSEFLRFWILLMFSFSIQLVAVFGKNRVVAMYPLSPRLGRSRLFLATSYIAIAFDLVPSLAARDQATLSRKLRK